MKTRFAVIDAPGFFGNNKAKVYSTHNTLEAAKKAQQRHAYIDERKQRRVPTCVVETYVRKGGSVFGDMMPKILAHGK